MSSQPTTSDPRPQVLADLVLATNRIAGHTRIRHSALVVAGAAWVAVLGQITIPLPFSPVPLSLGSFAVLTAGAALGAKRALASMLLFLAAGLAGAPVFAGGGHGAVPTLGYAVGYIAAATLVGHLAARRSGSHRLATFGTMVLGAGIIHLCGVPYLAWSAGLSLAQATALGLAPFVLADIIKAALAAGLLPAIWTLRTTHCRRH
ncbi:MAG: biotin transporter BioY [Micrococcales bacterium]|nr:biotin transporter BioY [Micrococcales bacterium]